MKPCEVQRWLLAFDEIYGALVRLEDANGNMELAVGRESREWAELQELTVKLRRQWLLMSRRLVRCSECRDVYRIADEPAAPLGELAESHGVCPECAVEWERRLGLEREMQDGN